MRARIEDLPAEKAQSIRAEMAPVEKALASDPNDQAAHVARAAIFEKYGLGTEALAEYKTIAVRWPDAVWVGSRVFAHESEQPAPEPPPSPFPAKYMHCSLAFPGTNACQSRSGYTMPTWTPRFLPATYAALEEAHCPIPISFY
jgi:hypothetical protein